MKIEKVTTEDKVKKDKVFIPTYAQVEELSAALQRMKNESIVNGNMPFKSANIQNRMLILPFVTAIRDVNEEPAGWEEYQKKLYELQQKHIQKFEDGSVKFFQLINGKEEEVRDQNGSYTRWTNDADYKKAFEELKKKYSDAISLKEEQPKLKKAFMAQPVDGFPKLYTVSGPFDKNFPEAILDVLVLFGIIDIKELK